MSIDFQQQIADLQTAMRALWPDTPKIYFNLTSAALAEDPAGRVLTQDEQSTLHRVAAALAAAREEGRKES